MTDTPRGGCVAACCARAAAAGVRPGMPLAEARSLVRGLAVAPYDPHADRRALEHLAEACEQFSPAVALEAGAQPQSLLLDVSNLMHLWGTNDALAGKVTKFFTGRGYQTRIAVANTPGLAWALAHFEKPDESALPDKRAGSSSTPADDCKLQNVNCKLQIEDEEESAFRNPHFAFSKLPIDALRAPPDTTALLRELGIERVGQLLTLPRDELAARFGDDLLKRLDQLTGTAAEPLTPHRALAPLAAECSLEHPTADRAAVTHVLSQLVDQLARQLAARDEGAVLVVCHLGCTGGQAVPLRVGLLQPSANAGQLMELVALHLKTVVLPTEVARVEVRVATVGRLGQRQRELFTERWPTDPHQLALLINRLSSRLGYEQVVRPQFRSSPLPERAVQYEPATGKSRVKGQGSRARTLALDSRLSTLDSSPRPLLLYPEPRPLEVVCVAPDGPPQCVWLAGHGGGDRARQRVTAHWGPERIETLWWQGRTVRRDYYRVAIESGSHLWIFRRLADGRWFLHGAFE